MRQLELRRTTGHLLQLPTKHRPKQRTKSEVNKIDDARCCTAKLRRVHFLDHRVRQHRRARSNPRNEAEHVRREHAGWSKEYPGHTNEKYYRAADDHRFAIT